MDHNILIIGVVIGIIVLIFIEWLIGAAIGESLTETSGMVLGIVLIVFFPFFISGIAVMVHSSKNKKEIKVNINIDSNQHYSRNITPETTYLQTTQKYLRSENKNWKDILEENNLTEYIDLFYKNKLTDLEIISDLTDSDLEKLGITIMGDKKKILKLFSKTNNKNIFEQNQKITYTVNKEEDQYLELPIKFIEKKGKQFIIKNQIALREGPFNDSKIIKRLTPKSKVRIIDVCIQSNNVNLQRPFLLLETEDGSKGYFDSIFYEEEFVKIE